MIAKISTFNQKKQVLAKTRSSFNILSWTVMSVSCCQSIVFCQEVTKSHAAGRIVFLKEFLLFKWYFTVQYRSGTHLWSPLFNCYHDVHNSEGPHQDCKGQEVICVGFSREFGNVSEIICWLSQRKGGSSTIIKWEIMEYLTENVQSV